MTLDVKLYKALRAGLGDKAAKLLADPADRYYLGAGTTDGGSSEEQYLLLVVADAVQAYADVARGQRVTTIAPVTVALTAGAHVDLIHRIYSNDDSVNGTPDLVQFGLAITKTADANGIPVAPVTTNFITSRADSAITLPSSQTGFTVAAASNPARGFKVTVAAAGWYVLAAYSALA